MFRNGYRERVTNQCSEKWVKRERERERERERAHAYVKGS